MAEEVSTIPDNSATIAEKVEKTIENVEKTVEKSEEAAPKKKGRPAGAKDKAPRAKKPRVVVVEEPLEAPVKTQSAGGQTVDFWYWKRYGRFPREKHTVDFWCWGWAFSIPRFGAPITETDGGGLPFSGWITFPFLFFTWSAPGALPRSARWRSCSYVNFI